MLSISVSKYKDVDCSNKNVHCCMWCVRTWGNETINVSMSASVLKLSCLHSDVCCDLTPMSPPTAPTCLRVQSVGAGAVYEIIHRYVDTKDSHGGKLPPAPTQNINLSNYLFLQRTEKYALLAVIYESYLPRRI